MKKVIIVESPSKAKSLKSYLDSSYRVLATLGHCVDLPEGVLGVDIQNNFSPEWVILKGKKKVLTGIKNACSTAETIYLATDPDREGEGIAYHVKNFCKLKKSPLRLRLKEISKEELFNQLKYPSTLDERLVDAQISRRILDRLTGYTISPTLWKFGKNLSAGRVQSPVLRWICERESEIKKFRPEPFFILTGSFRDNLTGKIWNATLSKDDKQYSLSKKELLSVLQTFGSTSLPNIQNFPEIGKSLNLNIQSPGYELRYFHVQMKKEYPPPPHSTSSLQKEAAQALKFSPGKTMKLSQSLYEGDSGGGYITYHRTDSHRISERGIGMALQYLSGHPEWKVNPTFRRKMKPGAQDAHEAIRPVRLPEGRMDSLSSDEKSLYKLIRDRFLISFLSPLEKKIARGILSKDNMDFLLTIEEVTDPGYRVYKNQIPPSTPIPDWEIGREFTLVGLEIFGRETSPPPRYREATLIEKMEKTGIGRPSTYATTLETLKKRTYILLEKGDIHPTELGLLVNEEVTGRYLSILEDGYTAEMEKSLDRIASGKLSGVEFLSRFYETLHSLKSEKSKPVKTRCPLCGEGELKKKISREKKVYFLCSRFPYCEYAEYITETKSAT